MSNPLEPLLEELSELTATPLILDVKGVCRMIINEKFELQLEIDQMKENLVVGSVICSIPPGRFRQNVLKEGLKENDLPHPRVGVLSYIEKNNTLFLFDILPLDELNGEKLAKYLEVFLEKAESWYTAIDGGLPSPNPETPLEDTPPPQFGMRL